MDDNESKSGGQSGVPESDGRLGLDRRGVTLLAVGFLVLLLACVLWIPRWLYPDRTEADLRNRHVTDGFKAQQLIDAQAKLQNDARTTLLQGFAALLVLTGAGIGAYVAYEQVKATPQTGQRDR